MKYTILFLLLLYAYSAFAQADPPPCPDNGICPYHEVPLSKGYQLNIGDTIENRRTIRLKGPGIDTILRSVKLKTSNSDLGWLAAYNDDLFVLYSTAPVHYEEVTGLTVIIYQKQTGKLLAQGAMINFNKWNEGILFIDYRQNEKLALFDPRTMQTEYFDPPETPCNTWWLCIKYTAISDNFVTVDFRDKNNLTKRKIYDRKS